MVHIWKPTKDEKRYAYYIRITGRYRPNSDQYTIRIMQEPYFEKNGKGRKIIEFDVDRYDLDSFLQILKLDSSKPYTL